MGRSIFNEVLPTDMPFMNYTMDKGAIKDLTSRCYQSHGNQETARVLDRIKDVGFHYATTAGITIAINDIQTSPRKQKIIDDASEQVKKYELDYMQGLMTEEERYTHTVASWTLASEAIEEMVKDDMDSYGGVAIMAISGAKGNIAQIRPVSYTHLPQPPNREL